MYQGQYDPGANGLGAVLWSLSLQGASTATGRTSGRFQSRLRMKKSHVLTLLVVLVAALVVVTWGQVLLLIFPDLGFGRIAARATPVSSPTAIAVPSPIATPNPTPTDTPIPSPSPSPTRSPGPSPSPSPSPSASPSPSPVSPTPTPTPPTPTPVPLAATPTVLTEVLGVESMPVTGAIAPSVSLGSAMGLLLIASGTLRRWLEKRE